MKHPRPVVVFPDPILRARCSELGGVSPTTRELASELRSSLSAAAGIGLAAPQIGETLRMILLRADARTTSGGGLIMIDPVITSRSDEDDFMMEGCLSLPGERHAVCRPVAVTVEYLTETGRRKTIALSGLAAKCVQHEIDHLDGVLIIDRALQPSSHAASSSIFPMIGATVRATASHFSRSR